MAGLCRLCALEGDCHVGMDLTESAEELESARRRSGPENPSLTGARVPSPYFKSVAQ